MNHKPYRFFLGANSSKGFVSFFENALEEETIRQNFIFKGGPGCGKSTAMKQAAEEGLRRQEPMEVIHCSSDPSSLDGVLFLRQGKALYDGTAPHTIDLAFPGAEGGYILPPPFLRAEELVQKADALQQVQQELSACYRQVFSLTAAAGQVEKRLHLLLSCITDEERLRRRAVGIVLRELPRGKGPGREKKRFLSGITPEGLLRFDETIGKHRRIYCLEDPYGFAPVLLEEIRQAAVERGQVFYGCYCPLCPEKLEHLIFPELSLAFVSSTPLHPYEGPCFRRLDLGRLTDRESLRPIRTQVRLLRKIQLSLLDDAVATLQKAKGCHDRLEALYRPHLDIPALQQTAEEVTQEIFPL